MKLQEEEGRQQLLESLDTVFREDLPAQQAEQMYYLAQRMLERAPLECFEDVPAHRLAQMVISISRFATQRHKGELKLRVYNPVLEEHGWESPNTVIEMINDDMPFLVDTTSLAISELDPDAAIHVMLHPLVRVVRDAGGNVLELEELDSDQGQVESIIHVQISKRTDPAELKHLHDGILASMRDVRTVVDDWQAMREQAVTVAEEMKKSESPFMEEEVMEAAHFVAWLAEEHFTFLGYQEYFLEEKGDKLELVSRPETALGLFRNHKKATRHSFDSHESEQVLREPLIITKTNARATVHRRGYMDYVGVLLFDKQGKLVGEKRMIGLFTSGAYYRRPWEIPYLRHQVEHVLQRSGLKPNSHNAKALLHVLETLPRDELFQSNIDDLYRMAMGVLQLQERRVTRVFIREDRYGRFYSCLIYMPRDRFDTNTRRQLTKLFLKVLRGTHADFSVQLSESLLARLHLIVRTRHLLDRVPDERAIEQEIKELTRDWRDDLTQTLVERLGEERGLRLAHRFANAFPASYREDVSPWVASFDLENIEQLQNLDDMRMSLYRPRNKREGLYRFKVFRYERTIPLSDVVPMLENMGLRVVNERPYELPLEEDLSLWIQDFDIQLCGMGELDLEAIRDEFQEAFEHVVRGDMENDGFNRLILAAQLNWAQVNMLRACCKYLLQTNNPFSQHYMEQALFHHPQITYLLVELFTTLFSPVRDEESEVEREWSADAMQTRIEQILRQREDLPEAVWLKDLLKARKGTREEQVQGIVEAIITALEGVRSQDEDRILRSFMGLMQGMLRTTYFQPHEDPNTEPYLAFKLNSAVVPDLPQPRPMFEIFVYSPRVEGVHLRGGKVARGGLRWSDRREDFRTEVLGLMKAQQVKNTIIVPVGAKGGFVVKQLPTGDRDTVMTEVVHCYRTFIGGLLDLTDNLQGDTVKPPLLTVRRDEDDPYMVVAADKGTATFSDIANSIAEQRGFWLGDAFASGGSAGYDHKKMGITARGAWESVKRHFRELGVDCQNEPFTCVGIGDMGGDVFGNGMLLSRKTRLLAAFNHMHIFIDPDPDPEISYQERERLFKLPRSTWEDYNPKLISKGGGVWSRSQKSIKLTPEVKAWLGLEVDKLPPQELIRELLKAPVDLLWNGGIGTYVKASSETHQDVGDHNNDILRIDATELRCRIVGEGGNLGLTQLARVEYALNGGRINTDFVDNAGGVDCSDHEVNIKILLNQAMEKGLLNRKQRDKLLKDMTDEVAALVLRSNYLQAQALSMMESMAVHRLGAKAHLISELEQKGQLDRQLEYLPSNEEIQERRARGQGLTRPELCVLLAYSKMDLYNELIASDLPDDPYFGQELVHYFPKPLQKKYAELMPAHRLHREIIATVVSNDMVNRMGSTFNLRMQEDTGASPAAIARAYTLAKKVLHADVFWGEVEALDNQVPAQVQIDILMRMWNLMRHICRWLLNQHGHELDIAAFEARYSQPMRELIRFLYRALDPETQQRVEQDTEALENHGLPHSLARRCALMPAMFSALDLVEIAQQAKAGVEKTARLYFSMGDRLRLNWLAGQIEKLAVEGQWHANARAALRDELYQHHRTLVLRLLQKNGKQSVKQLLEAWLNQYAQEVDYLEHMLGDMKASSHVDYAMISVAIRGVSHLIRASERS